MRGRGGGGASVPTPTEFEVVVRQDDELAGEGLYLRGGVRLVGWRGGRLGKARSAGRKRHHKQAQRGQAAKAPTNARFGSDTQ